jgi:hypothetical protein
VLNGYRAPRGAVPESVRDLKITSAKAASRLEIAVKTGLLPMLAADQRVQLSWLR